MDDVKSRSRAEILVSVFFIIVCLVVLWESRLIPPGTFEPLGSAPIPQATALIIIALSVLTMVRAVFALRREKSTMAKVLDDDTKELHQPRYTDALAILGLIIVYCLVLHSKAVAFSIATCVFLILAIGLLVRFNPRSMIVVAVVSVLMGFGCQYLFTRVFVVDLPGAF